MSSLLPHVLLLIKQDVIDGLRLVPRPPRQLPRHRVGEARGLVLPQSAMLQLQFWVMELLKPLSTGHRNLREEWDAHPHPLLLALSRPRSGEWPSPIPAPSVGDGLGVTVPGDALMSTHGFPTLLDRSRPSAHAPGRNGTA